MDCAIDVCPCIWRALRRPKYILSLVGNLYLRVDGCVEWVYSSKFLTVVLLLKRWITFPILLDSIGLVETLVTLLIEPGLFSILVGPISLASFFPSSVYFWKNIIDRDKRTSKNISFFLRKVLHLYLNLGKKIFLAYQTVKVSAVLLLGSLDLYKNQKIIFWWLRG